MVEEQVSMRNSSGRKVRRTFQNTYRLSGNTLIPVNFCTHDLMHGVFSEGIVVIKILRHGPEIGFVLFSAYLGNHVQSGVIPVP